MDSPFLLEFEMVVFAKCLVEVNFQNYDVIVTFLDINDKSTWSWVWTIYGSYEL